MAVIAAPNIGRRHLVVFLDYLYAAIIALSLAEAFTTIVAPLLARFQSPALAGRGWHAIAVGVSNRIAAQDVKSYLIAALLFIAAFWFVVDDWLDTRGLTEIHPYQSFRRFFIDVLTAFFSYAALLYATRRSILMLVFIFLIHLLSVWWSQRLLADYPNSSERGYVSFYKFGCGGGAVIALVTLISYLWRYGTAEIGAIDAVILSVLGLCWLATFDVAEELWGHRAQPAWDPPTPFLGPPRLRRTLLPLGLVLEKMVTRMLRNLRQSP